MLLFKVIRLLVAAFLGFGALALTGCASITGSSQQSVSVEARDSAKSVAGASCELTNDKGKWFLNTPGSAFIQKSNENLNVLCRKDGLEAGQTSVASTTKAGMVGNILFGGFIGMAIDHSSGAAYEYPPLIQVMMGTSSIIDQTTGAATNSSQASNVTPQVSAAPSSIQKNINPSLSVTEPVAAMSMDSARVRCTELGMKPQTESFGQCVMKLSR
jgi:hypothetical protein